MIQDVKKLRDITDHPKDFFAKEKEDENFDYFLRVFERNFFEIIVDTGTPLPLVTLDTPLPLVTLDTPFL